MNFLFPIAIGMNFGAALALIFLPGHLADGMAALVYMVVWIGAWLLVGGSK